jgi:hypothetical protein
MHSGEIAYVIINVTSYKMSAVITLLEYSFVIIPFISAFTYHLMVKIRQK